jgi:hypothetical protein
LKALKAYKEKYDADPGPFLEESEWMSSEISELDTEDEGKKTAHRESLANGIGLTVGQLGDQIVWEVVRPAWRAPLVFGSAFLGFPLTTP